MTINRTAFTEASFSIEHYILCALSCNKCREFTLSENIELEAQTDVGTHQHCWCRLKFNSTSYAKTNPYMLTGRQQQKN